MPETKPIDFELYLLWLYSVQPSARYTDPDLEILVQKVYDDTESTAHWQSAMATAMVRLYILGDYLGDDSFCNAIVDTLIQVPLKTYNMLVFDNATVDLAWNKTLPGSTLRKVLVDLIICDIGDVGVGIAPIFEDRGSWSKDVSIEVFARMDGNKELQKAMESAVTNPAKGTDRCAYHRHEDGAADCPKAFEP